MLFFVTAMHDRRVAVPFRSIFRVGQQERDQPVRTEPAEADDSA
jgi:hypothetical protein